MTNVKAYALLPLTLCLALPATAKPVPKVTPEQREIQAIYNRISAAAAAKDVDGLYDYNSDDYVVIDRKGRSHDATEGRQEVEQALEIVDSVRDVNVIQSFEGTDADATVTVKEHIVVKAANNITGRAIKITGDDVARDHWIKTDDGWRRNRTRILSGHNALHKNF